MRILLFGHGISNDGVKRILDKYLIKYDYYEEAEIKDYNYDIVIKAPFIPYHNKTIKNLEKNNSLVITDFEFIYWIYKKNIISITGTNGKTTTASLLHDLLNDYVLCGNIGYAFGDAILDNDSNNLIIEASSFELEGCIKYKPNISIFLPINKAHLDHHKTFRSYFLSKMKNASNLDKNDLIIYPYEDKAIKKYIEILDCNKLSYSLKSSKANIYINNNMLMYEDFKININELWSSYKHNILNSMIVILVGKYLKSSNEDILKTLTSFKGVKYRLEKVIDNIYNDSKSTNIYSTINAIKEFKSIRLIAGGYEKYDDLRPLDNYLSSLKCVYLYGMNKNRLYDYFNSHNIKCYLFNNLYEATNKALEENLCDTILFSPMSASYDQYKNYILRGEDFENIVKDYYKI